MKTKATKSNRPATLQDCIDSDEPIVRFQDAYKKWLKIDYKDILTWSRAILNALTSCGGEIGQHGNDAVKLLAQAAQSIQMAKGEMPRDVVGITFCNAIEAAKEEGAMYTTLPAATLLTRLMFHNHASTGKTWRKSKASASSTSLAAAERC